MSLSWRCLVKSRLLTKLKSCSSFSIITSAHFCNGCQIVHLDKRSLTKHFEKSKHKMYFKFSKNRKNICWKDMDFVMMQNTIGQKSTSFFSSNQKWVDFDPIFFVAKMKYFWKVIYEVSVWVFHLLSETLKLKIGISSVRVVFEKVGVLTQKAKIHNFFLSAISNLPFQCNF